MICCRGLGVIQGQIRIIVNGFDWERALYFFDQDLDSSDQILKLALVMENRASRYRPPVAI